MNPKKEETVEKTVSANISKVAHDKVKKMQDITGVKITHLISKLILKTPEKQWKVFLFDE